MARNPPDVTLGQHPEIKIDLPKNTAEKKKADLISPPSKASIITIPKDAEEKKKNDLISPPNKEKHGQVFKMGLVILVPIVSLISITAASLDTSRVTWRTTETAFSAIHAAVDVGAVVVNIQIECGFSTLYLGSQKGEITRYKMADSRDDVDDLLSKLTVSWKYFPILKNTFPTPSHLKMRLDTHRTLLLGGNVTAVQNIVFYSDIHDMLLNSIVHEVRLPSSRSLWKSLVALDSLYRAGGAAGVQRTLGGVYFTQCWLPASEKLWFIQLESQLKTFLSQGTQYHPSVRALKKRNLNHISPLVKALQIRKEEIMNLDNTGLVSCQNNTRGWSVDRSLQWFDNMTMYLSVLGNMRAHLEVDALGQLKVISAGARNKLAIYSSIMAAVTVICLMLGLWYAVRLTSMTSQIRLYAKNMTNKSKELQIEQQRTDELLKQMLPRTVVNALKQKRTVEPEYFNCVTIYFSDIIGFTRISVKSSPHEIVNLLNAVYRIFDEIIEKYDVYKVETIGDGYMVASGLPELNGSEHARQIALMSLELMSSMANFVVPHDENEEVNLRVGIHSGPCVAGVLGTKMPRYCLFGDTINTASRMETTGDANKIHISSVNKHLLDTVGVFETVKRGTVNVKGKGEMITYWLMSYQGKHSHMDIHNFPKIDVHSEDFKHDELDDGKKICKTDKQEYANLF